MCAASQLSSINTTTFGLLAVVAVRAQQRVVFAREQTLAGCQHEFLGAAHGLVPGEEVALDLAGVEQCAAHGERTVQAEIRGARAVFHERVHDVERLAPEPAANQHGDTEQRDQQDGEAWQEAPDFGVGVPEQAPPQEEQTDAGGEEQQQRPPVTAERHVEHEAHVAAERDDLRPGVAVHEAEVHDVAGQQQQEQCQQYEVGPGPEAQPMAVMSEPEWQQHQQQWTAGNQRDDRGVEQQAARERAQHLKCREVVKVLQVDEKQTDPRQEEDQQGERENREDAAVRLAHGILGENRNVDGII